jgi:hypothetical protein
MKSKLVYILIAIFAIGLFSGANNTGKKCTAISYCCKAAEPAEKISNIKTEVDDYFVFPTFNPLIFN